MASKKLHNYLIFLTAVPGEAMKYIQSRNASKDPFFLYLSYYAVHAPFEAKDSLIAKYRNKNPVEMPVISTDLYPTFAGWAGAMPPENHPLDGISLNPLLQGKPLKGMAVFWYAPVYLPNKGDFAFRMTPSATTRESDEKLIWFYGTGKTELYNLREDLGETHDLSNEQPGRAKQLLTELRAWHEATAAEIPTERNPQFDSLYTFGNYESIGYE